jgi:hypothetical protein
MGVGVEDGGGKARGHAGTACRFPILTDSFGFLGPVVVVVVVVNPRTTARTMPECMHAW